MSAAAIKRLDAGVRFGAEFRRERIPTLAEVAQALGARGRGRCELRRTQGAGLEARVCDILRGCGAMNAIISSFDGIS